MSRRSISELGPALEYHDDIREACFKWVIKADEIKLQQLEAKYRSLVPLLDERMRRQ
jgi:hypothetical protein